MAKMSMGELLAAIEYVGELKAELKARSMIYQVEEKESAAMWARVPFDTFYQSPDWPSIRTAYKAAMEDAFEKCRLAGIPDNLAYCEFPLFRELMGYPPL